MSDLKALRDLTAKVNRQRAEFEQKYAGMSHEEKLEAMFLDLLMMVYVELYIRRG